VLSLHIDLIARSVFLCQSICLLAIARFGSFRLHYGKAVLVHFQLHCLDVFLLFVNRKVLL
jgi:hypothetical protein